MSPDKIFRTKKYLFVVDLLFVGVLCWSLFWYVSLYVLSSFEIHLNEEERAGCFAFVVFQMSCCCKCSVAETSSRCRWLVCGV